MRRMESLRARLLGFGVAAVMLAACTVAGSSPSPSLPGVGIAEAVGDWRLVEGVQSGRPIPIVPGADITLTVEEGRIAGRAACNQYGGEIVVQGDEISFGSVFMTEMACAEPIMASESAYLAALAEVRSAGVANDRLRLMGDGVDLVFERLVPVPTAALISTDWVLDSLVDGDGISSVAGAPATLRLGPGGDVTGSTGCRSFSGRWTEAAGMIAVTDLALGREPCSADLAAQDAHVIEVLESGFRAEVDGEHLTVAGPGDRGLRYFTVVPEVPPLR